MASLYEVLGIPPSASGGEIKAAYRRLARSCHPDAVSVALKETSAGEFIKIHAAYSTLSDPSKRADYDRDFYQQRRRFVWPSPVSHFSSGGFSAYSCSSRNWETDQCW